MASSSASRAPEHADAGGAAHLVAGEGDEVGAQAGDVGGQVGHVLAGVDDDDGAGGVGGVDEALAPGGACRARWTWR